MNKSSRSAGDVASIKIQMNIHNSNSHICIEQVAIKFVSIKRQNEKERKNKIPVNRCNGANSRSFDMLNRELHMRLSFFTWFATILFDDGDVFDIETGGGPLGDSDSPFL